jgi:hypothetical protein
MIRTMKNSSDHIGIRLVAQCLNQLVLAVRPEAGNNHEQCYALWSSNRAGNGGGGGLLGCCRNNIRVFELTVKALTVDYRPVHCADDRIVVVILQLVVQCLWLLIPLNART